jgi:hypothetical protein
LPAQYGDNVVIRMKHSGKERVIVRLNDFDPAYAGWLSGCPATISKTEQTS